MALAENDPRILEDILWDAIVLHIYKLILQEPHTHSRVDIALADELARLLREKKYRELGTRLKDWKTAMYGFPPLKKALAEWDSSKLYREPNITEE